MDLDFIFCERRGGSKGRAHVLTPGYREHSRFKAFLHSVHIVVVFLDTLPVLAALGSGDLHRGTPILTSM